jgi:hypothetical protein
MRRDIKALAGFTSIVDLASQDPRKVIVHISVFEVNYYRLKPVAWRSE